MRTSLLCGGVLIASCMLFVPEAQAQVTVQVHLPPVSVLIGTPPVHRPPAYAVVPAVRPMPIYAPVPRRHGPPVVLVPARAVPVLPPPSWAPGGYVPVREVPVRYVPVRYVPERYVPVRYVPVPPPPHHHPGWRGHRH